MAQFTYNICPTVVKALHYLLETSNMYQHTNIFMTHGYNKFAFQAMKIELICTMFIEQKLA